MNEKKECACATAPKLVFPCSGASDVGEIADRAGRKLTTDGDGKMYCLAGIGGQVSGIVESTKVAAKILAIDGCPQDCAKKTLELAGFTSLEHLRVTDIGLEKGKSPVTLESITKVTEKAKTLLACS
jgi:uncharacterized metal-binding protein